MSKQKLTEWFPADVKPVNVGAYERKNIASQNSPTVPLYWYWNGIFWEVGGWLDPIDAKNNIRSVSLVDNMSWRGLAEKPE